MNKQDLWKAIEAYRSSGGREEHWRNRDALAIALDELFAERDALAARLAEIEKQTPVAWTNASWLSNPHAGHFRADRANSFDVPLYAAPVATKPLSDLPEVCDDKEQEAFEDWAKSQHLPMAQHPLHYLFLDGTTDGARQGWKAAITYFREAAIKEKK